MESRERHPQLRAFSIRVRLGRQAQRACGHRTSARALWIETTTGAAATPYTAAIATARAAVATLSALTALAASLALAAQPTTSVVYSRRWRKLLPCHG